MEVLDKMNIGEDQLQVSQIVSEATLSRKPDFLLGVELKAFLKDDNGIKGRIFTNQTLILKYLVQDQPIFCALKWNLS